MIQIFAAVRSLIYATAFVLLWGWVALQARSIGGGLPLPAAPSRVAGTGLMVAGGILAFSCVAWFVIAGRGTPAPFDPPRSLVPGGPYRWVRNPMYLGAFLVLVGFGLWHASLSMVLVVVPVAVLAHLFVVFYEEPTLERRFGIPYVAYTALVNRWIPKPPNRDAVQGV